MAVMYYWTGDRWEPIASGGGGGGGTGPQGPPGADGISIEVYGPQPAPPLNPRKGDQWLDSNTLGASDGEDIIQMPTPEPETIFIKRLPPDPDPVVVKRLPPTPEPVIVYLS